MTKPARKKDDGTARKGSGGSARKSGRQREAVFQQEFIEDLRFWIKTDRKIAMRILTLIEETLRDPFDGRGKPEALKFLLADCWSRRITQEHRLVYRVGDDRIDFLQARFHY